ncbi:GNAT family N-acetyltransferase [Exiguobacterium sp. N5]|uniref:GNAT family N-acetyltransferase n=1 Tax=Exiguobacterium sp. N5 TaxID=2990450 RepID=UPI0021F4C65D|nr:GNAT family N-acetyltransferase [Exiguobacterium sp. N5]MCV9899642.1 GNAT family N-acetyltransferase [Exiguobacterium sp. N5]
MGFKQVTLQDVIPLRHVVLRPGKDVETCYFEGDEAPTTRHFAWVEGDRVLSVATVMMSPKQIEGEGIPLQLRGMATDPHFSGQGIGSRFLQALHDELGCPWWCNAREVAVRFYERNGLTRIGEPFDIPEIGPHYIMVYKKTAGSE